MEKMSILTMMVLLLRSNRMGLEQSNYQLHLC